MNPMKYKLYFVIFQLDLTTATKSNRFYWIKIALFEKKLYKIISFLVVHSER